MYSSQIVLDNNKKHSIFLLDYNYPPFFLSGKDGREFLLHEKILFPPCIFPSLIQSPGHIFGLSHRTFLITFLVVLSPSQKVNVCFINEKHSSTSGNCCFLCSVWPNLQGHGLLTAQEVLQSLGYSLQLSFCSKTFCG